jgi:transcriptional regulator with XRE-family HTH domain
VIFLFHNRLKELRINKKLTQCEISKLLNIAQNTYSQYERGIREPDINTLIKIADFHSTSVDFIIDRYK